MRSPSGALWESIFHQTKIDLFGFCSVKTEGFIPKLLMTRSRRRPGWTRTRTGGRLARVLKARMGGERGVLFVLVSGCILLWSYSHCLLVFAIIIIHYSIVLINLVPQYSILFAKFLQNQFNGKFLIILLIIPGLAAAGSFNNWRIDWMQIVWCFMSNKLIVLLISVLLCLVGFYSLPASDCLLDSD